jgi:hypothetical protein
MTYPVESVRTGGWLVAIYKAISCYDIDDPSFDHFEDTIVGVPFSKNNTLVTILA